MKRFFSFVLISIFLFSCGRKYNTQMPIQETECIEHLKREILMRVNRELVEEDSQVIKEFVEKQNWEMNTSETGLWYMIYNDGSGEKATIGKTVTIEYTLSLLNEEICYSTDERGPVTFMLGYNDEYESGLQEALQMMRAGDWARLILPPHLAHGLLGDLECIPKRAAVVYEVKLLAIES